MSNEIERIFLAVVLLKSQFDSQQCRFVPDALDSACANENSGSVHTTESRLLRFVLPILLVSFNIVKHQYKKNQYMPFSSYEILKELQLFTEECTSPELKVT